MKIYNNKYGEIVELYKSATMKTEDIAKQFGVHPRAIQRLVKKYGVIRTNAEANKAMAKLKNYDSMRKPAHLKAQRKWIGKRKRVEIIQAHPYCAICGNRAIHSPLQVDHIDNNATNNADNNLQVLCLDCNIGKAQAFRASRTV